MTVWNRVTCKACGSGIGVRHPVFTALPREEHGWDPFVGCRICGDLLCKACAQGSETCATCNEPWQEDTYPPVWLNQHRALMRSMSSCLVCDSPTRSLSGRPDPERDPEGRWYACMSCASEFCEPCARRRRERCSCLMTLELRAVPPWSAYLPESIRERHVDLTPAERLADLQRRASWLRSAWDRGLLSRWEAKVQAWPLFGALADSGVDPGSQPWLDGESEERP
jgi:hypothetical protein